MNEIRHCNQESGFEEFITEIESFLTSVDGSQFNICASLYNIIMRAEESIRFRLFENAATLYEYRDSSETLAAPISKYENQKDELKEKYGDLVNSFISYFVQQKETESVFYMSMWNTIHNEMFFPDEAARTFAFYYILIDKRIPYFELVEGFFMDNHEFKSLYQKHAVDICRIRFILSSEMKQRTERASLILRELGIEIPNSEAPKDQLDEYKRKLIITVELMKSKSNSSVHSLTELLEKIRG